MSSRFQPFRQHLQVRFQDSQATKEFWIISRNYYKENRKYRKQSSFERRGGDSQPRDVIMLLFLRFSSNNLC